MIHRQNSKYHSLFIKFLLGTLLVVASFSFYRDLHRHSKVDLLHKSSEHKKIVQEFKFPPKTGKKSGNDFSDLLLFGIGVMFLSTLIALIMPSGHIIYKRIKAEMDSVRDPPPSILI